MKNSIATQNFNEQKKRTSICWGHKIYSFLLYNLSFPPNPPLTLFLFLTLLFRHHLVATRDPEVRWTLLSEWRGSRWIDEKVDGELYQAHERTHARKQPRAHTFTHVRTHKRWKVCRGLEQGSVILGFALNVFVLQSWLESQAKMIPLLFACCLGFLVAPHQLTSSANNGLIGVGALSVVSIGFAAGPRYARKSP